MRNKSDAELAQEIAEFLAQAPPSRRQKMPRYDARKGVWRGGDSRTLYAFIGHRTGQVFVRPGGDVINVGPEVTVRMATRDEAEREWQNPLHAGWKVVE